MGSVWLQQLPICLGNLQNLNQPNQQAPWSPCICLTDRVLDLLANLLDMDEDGMISGEEVERAQEMAAAARRRGGQRMTMMH